MNRCGCAKLVPPCFTLLQFSVFLILYTSKAARTWEISNHNFLIPPGYNKYQTPLEEIEQPTYVYINLNVMDIDEIIEERMEYSMQFYVNEYWKDSRLNTSFVGDKGYIFRVPKEWIPRLWLPDTIFENSKGGWIYPLSLPNIVLQVRAFGYLHRYTRYAMKVTCAMDLHYYPMDTQNCFLDIASLAYDNTKLLLKWMHERKEGDEGIKDLTLAELKPLKYQIADMSPGTKIVQWSSGNFTVLYANFTFVRQLSSHIMNVYIPSSLVVILAFLTFWLNVKSVPARVALGLTSLLTLSTQASQSRAHLPQINYLTALDIWLFTCMIFVFLSLVEFTMVYHHFNRKVLKRRQTEANVPSDDSWAKRTRSVSRTSSRKIGNQNHNSKHGQKDITEKSKTSIEFEEEPQYLDRLCRLLFPTLFFVFSFAYWLYFLKSGT